MKFSHILLAGLLSFAVFTRAMANDFEVALSRDTAQFTFRSDSSMIGWGGADLALGLFYNEASDFLFDASLLQMRQASEQNPLTFGVGVAAYLGKLDDINSDVFAFGIGGEVRYTIPGTMPMAVYFRGYYAPEITSFADADSLLDYQFGFQIEALPQTTAFIGIRHLEIDTRGVDYLLSDDEVFLGVRLTF
jgi:hypothetical protein